MIKELMSIKCETQQEITSVLKLLLEMGVRWADGTSLRDLKLDTLNQLNPCYLNINNDMVIFTNFPNKTKTVDAKEFIVKNSGKIIIYRDGKRVIAKDKDGNVAEAKCHPDDEFDFKVGAKLAFHRLMELKEEKAQTVKVKDRVKFKDPNNIHSYAFEWFQKNVRFQYWHTAYAYATPFVFTPEEIIDSEVMLIAPHLYNEDKMLALVRVVYKGTDLDVFYLTDLDNLEKIDGKK